MKTKEDSSSFLLSTFNVVQRILSKAQGIPIVGLVPSIVKFSFSIIQIIWGSFQLGSCGALGLLFNNSMALDLSIEGGIIIIYGGLSLSYSVLNFSTLTAFGFGWEYGKYFWDKPEKRIQPKN